MQYDPEKFGVLTNKVDTLTTEVAKLRAQQEELIGLVNRGRGAFWITMLLGSAVGGLVVAIIEHAGLGSLLK